MDFSSAPILAVAVSPDGQRVAAATGDRRLGVVPLRRPFSDGARFSKLAAEAAVFADIGSVSALSYPGDATLYAAKTTGALTRYNVGDGQTKPLQLEFEISDAHGVGGEVTGIAAVSERSLVVTCGKDAAVRCWNPETRQSVARLTGHKYEVRAVAAAESESASGNREVVNIIASAGRDKTVRLWDVRASESNPIFVFSGHTGWVHDVAISGGGGRSVVVSCAGDKSVRVWDLGMMRQAQVFTGHEYRVWGVAVSSDGGFAISGSTDTTVRAWDLSQPADAEDASVIFEGHRDSVICVSVSRDGTAAVSGCEDGSLHAWNTTSIFGRTGGITQAILSTESAECTKSVVADHAPALEESQAQLANMEASDDVLARAHKVSAALSDEDGAVSSAEVMSGPRPKPTPSDANALSSPLSASLQQSTAVAPSSPVKQNVSVVVSGGDVSPLVDLSVELPRVAVSPKTSGIERYPFESSQVPISSEQNRIEQLERELEAAKRLALNANTRVGTMQPARQAEALDISHSHRFSATAADADTPCWMSINERLQGIANRLDALLAS